MVGQLRCPCLLSVQSAPVRASLNTATMHLSVGSLADTYPADREKHCTVLKLSLSH